LLKSGKNTCLPILQCEHSFRLLAEKTCFALLKHGAWLKTLLKNFAVLCRLDILWASGSTYGCVMNNEDKYVDTRRWNSAMFVCTFYTNSHLSLNPVIPAKKNIKTKNWQIVIHYSVKGMQ